MRDRVSSSADLSYPVCVASQLAWAHRFANPIHNEQCGLALGGGRDTSTLRSAGRCPRRESSISRTAVDSELRISLPAALEKATSDASVRRPDGYPSASEAGLSPWTSGPAHAFLPIRAAGAPRIRLGCAAGAPRRRRGCAASAVPGSNPAGFGTRSDRIADPEVILFRTLVRDRVICETGVVYTIRVFARQRWFRLGVLGREVHWNPARGPCPEKENRNAA